jgi:hypothetical protein
MHAKFGRSSDVRQINFIQPEHGYRRHWERDRSREETRQERERSRERKGRFVLRAKQGFFQRSGKATVRHDNDEDQIEDKSLPSSARHNIEHYSPTVPSVEAHRHRCNSLHHQVLVIHMNIDRRLEKLAKRDKALSKSLKLLARDVRALTEGTKRLLKAAKRHDKKRND